MSLSRKASTSVSPRLSSSLIASTTSSSRRVSLLASVRAMRYESLKAAGRPSEIMRRKVSRGIFMPPTLPAAVTVADAPLSPSRPLSPTTVGSPAASISASSRSLPPASLFLTSTLPDVSTYRLPGSAPSSMMVSPARKDTGSEASANSSLSSSVRNSKNLTPCKPSSNCPSPLRPHSLRPRIICPTRAPRPTPRGPRGGRGQSEGPLLVPCRAEGGVRKKSEGAASPPRPHWNLGWFEALPDDLHVHVVRAGVGKADLLGRRRGQVELPTPHVRPAVVDHDDGGVSTVAHEQLGPERVLQRGGRVIGVRAEDLAARGEVALEARSVPARQLRVRRGAILQGNQRDHHHAGHHHRL